MPHGTTLDVGDRPAGGGSHVVGTTLHQVMKYPAAKLDGLFAYMLEVGLDVDVPNATLVNVLAVSTGRTPEHLGPYTGRFNLYMQKRGYKHRLVIGGTAKTHRLILIL